jgi:EAL domain-containing protein (putative c-di-GMP-specific phosphodiesterase class I)
MSAPNLLDLVLGPGGLSPVFQPIFESHAGGLRIHGLEALIRGPRGTRLEDADILFDYVRRKAEEPRVDGACVTAVFEAARLLPQGLRLSINVHASTLGSNPEFVTFIADAASRASIELDLLTVEIVEHAPFWDGAAFHNSLMGLRDIGIAIALDDVGHGQSNYRMVVECQPDEYKIDRYFVHGAGHDHYRSVVLDSIRSLAERLGGFAVAEGVEDAADLETVTKIGIRYVQGYFLSAPHALAGASVGPLLKEWSDRGMAASRGLRRADHDGHYETSPTRLRAARYATRDSLAPGWGALEG